MTQLQLHRAVAQSTGDSLSTVRHLGFTPQTLSDAEPEPDDLALCLDCPFCGRKLVLVTTDTVPRALPVVAECDPCDLYFDYRLDEIYASTPHPDPHSSQTC